MNPSGVFSASQLVPLTVLKRLFTMKLNPALRFFACCLRKKKRVADSSLEVSSGKLEPFSG